MALVFTLFLTHWVHLECRIRICPVLIGRLYIPIQCWKKRTYFPTHVFLFIILSIPPEMSGLSKLAYCFVFYCMAWWCKGGGCKGGGCNGGGCKLDFPLFLYCTACQHPEALPASIYGHLRE